MYKTCDCIAEICGNSPDVPVSINVNVASHKEPSSI